MKKFFKLTKAKVILAFPFLLLLFIIVQVILFSGWSSEQLCIPNISGTSAAQPSPTPQPLTVPNVVSDFQYESYTSGGADCLGNGPTEHMATFLFTSYQIIGGIFFFILQYIVPVIGSYVISCAIILYVEKLKHPKKKLKK